LYRPPYAVDPLPALCCLLELLNRSLGFGQAEKLMYLCVLVALQCYYVHYASCLLLAGINLAAFHLSKQSPLVGGLRVLWWSNGFLSEY
jgi:hypothetical protein